MTEFKPRYYQTECVDAFLRDAKQHPSKNLLAALPTGTGKSVVIADLCRRIADLGGRVMVLHRSKELVYQNDLRYSQFDPESLKRSGVYSAGIGIRQTNAQVTFAGIQSVYKRAAEFGKLDALVIDEAHQVSFDEDSQYKQFIRDVLEINPKCRAFGLTATPFRTDGVIHGDKRSFFDRMSYVTPLSDMFENGWLTKPITLPTVSVDMKGVKKTAGDYNQAEMQSRFLAYWSGNAKTKEIVKTANSKGRKSCMVFCSGVAHAELVQAELEAMGESSRIVTGETLPLLRETFIDQFSKRKVRWLVNVNVLTTGFDASVVDYIVVARATESAGLFQQIVGRGLRLHEGKTECYVTDFGGNTERFGPIDSETYGEGYIKAPTDGTGEPPKRVCSRCFAVFAAGKRVCPECGITLPEKEKVMISSQKEITTKITEHEVLAEKWTLNKGKEIEHQGETIKKLDTLRVQYRLAVDEKDDLDKRVRWATEWTCPLHSGFPREKFESWWKQRSNTSPPETIEEAIRIMDEGMVARTSRVWIKPDGKWTRIIKSKCFPKPESGAVDFDEPLSAEEMYGDDMPF